MREIKFRAWNKNGFMVYWDDMLISLMAAQHQVFEDKNLVVMQYTGLKDRRGKEIYEGDILTHKFYTTPVVVQWVAHNAGFEAGDVSWGEGSHLERLGNIYENPELLKP